MSQTRAPAFSFKVGSHEAESLSVSHISGREGLNRLYEFQVGFHPLADEPLEAQELLGAEALLTVLLPEGKTRHVHGWVRAVDTLGQQGGALAVPSVGGAQGVVAHAGEAQPHLTGQGGATNREGCAEEGSR